MTSRDSVLPEPRPTVCSSPRSSIGGPGAVRSGSWLVRPLSPSQRAIFEVVLPWIRTWDRPLLAALQALVVYAIFAARHGSVWQASAASYYNYLADAFLHGQLYFRLIPATTHDLSLFGGHLYPYWGPFPALLLLPFVAVWGVRFSDVAFTLLLGAANVALTAVLLRLVAVRGIARLSRLQRGLLVLFFALGTVQVTLAPYGRVWFTGQLVGYACVALAYLAALALRGRRALVFSGLAVAAALATRTNLVFAGIWPLLFLAFRGRTNLKRLAGDLFAFAAPLALALLALGVYNLRRFGSPLEFGYSFHQMSAFLAEDYRRYGPFNLHFIPINLYYQYLLYPFPPRSTTLMGGSLFLLSPVFFAAFAGIKALAGRSLALVASIVFVALPILLLFGTGWVQFGPRYTLDFTVPLLILAAAGVRRWPARLLWYLTLASLVQYLVGAALLSTAIE